MSQSQAPLDRFRRPEHTGENRCQPCTVVNLVLAVALAGAVAVVAVELAVGVFALSLAVIYLRGYLVPYTPTLTTRYLPEPVLRALGKEPAPEGAYTDTTWDAVEKLRDQRENAVDVDQFLLDIEAVRPAPGDDEREYLLTDTFGQRVAAHAEEREPIESAAIAALFDADVADVTRKDREYPAYEVGVRIRKWPSEAALRSDVATHRAMDEWTERWHDVPVEQRSEILELLRTCHTACPDCGGPLSETSETVESCCVNIDRYAFRCEDCGVHLRESGSPTELDGKGLTGS